MGPATLAALAAVPALRAGTAAATTAASQPAVMTVTFTPQQFHLVLAVLSQVAYAEQRTDAYYSLYSAAYWHVHHADKPQAYLAGTVAADFLAALDQWPTRQQA